MEGAAGPGFSVVAQRDAAGARVRDTRYAAPDGAEVAAWLVEPADTPGSGAGPGVLFAHWFDPDAPDGNRDQFLAEAEALARAGVASLLPQGRFPWAGDPTDAAADRARIDDQVAVLRRGLDLLTSAAVGADPARLAFVGHDFGAMYGAILAGEDRRAQGYVLMAAVPRWGDWFLPFWRITDDRIDYLRALRDRDPIEHVGRAAPARLLFQSAADDFYIAEMTARELARAASEPRELRRYPGDHALRDLGARADRLAFLAEVLGLAAAPAVPAVPATPEDAAS
ncbi:MAG: hypothetical protein U0869_08290 [Chloroflexota bacterium]